LTRGKVRYRRDRQIGRVTLASPDNMNALDESLMTALFDALREANADVAARTIVIDAEGPQFSAGGDLNWEKEFDEASATRLMRLTGHLSYELRNAAKPTIGAIRGYCLGGGNELNCHLDLAIASETARFGQPETRWGLVPFWFTPQLLPLIVGERRAREMLLVGRMYDAEAALEMGLCNAVVPDSQLESEVDSWAAEIAERSPLALRLTRVALNTASDLMRSSANHEAAMVSTVVGSESYRAAVEAFFSSAGNRRPRQQGPRRRT
jgi:naphthoate synthase/2-ketocyclohexanecarboxyl-CoA hydrolase